MSAILKTFIILLACSAIGACTSDSGERYSAPDNIYTMRGRIASLPAAGEHAREIKIHHEAVDDFRNSSGEVDPMPEMTMPFPLADHISLEGFGVGDAVEFRYEVRWKAQPHEQITALKKIPAGSVHLSDSAMSM